MKNIKLLKFVLMKNGQYVIYANVDYCIMFVANLFSDFSEINHAILSVIKWLKNNESTYFIKN